MECDMDTSEPPTEIAKDKIEEGGSKNFADFDKLINEELLEKNGKDPVLETLVCMIESEINTVKKLGNECWSNESKLNEPINVNLLQIIAKLCTEENYSILIDSGLVKVCMNAIRTAVLPSDFIKHSIGILCAVSPYHVETCKYITNTTEESKQLFQNICHLFTSLHASGKCIILTLFDNIIKQALTLDDVVFDAVLYKTCSALDTKDEALLLRCVIGIDNLVETYQEWDVNKKLFSMSTIPSLVAILSHPSEEIVLKALRSLGNLLSAENQTINQCVISAGIQTHLMLFLVNERKNNDIVRNCLWVLSNIAAGPKGSIKCFFDYDLLPVVLQYLKCKQGDVALESLWVLANLFEDASDEERRWLLKNEELISSFVHCLSEQKSNMQGPSTEGLVYLELLRDTFQTVIKCLKTPKVSEKNEVKSETEQNEDSNDNSDSEHEHISILLCDEIKKLLKFLIDLDLHGKLLHLKTSEDCATMNDTFKEILEDFESVVSKHLDIKLVKENSQSVPVSEAFHEPS